MRILCCFLSVLYLSFHVSCQDKYTIEYRNSIDQKINLDQVKLGFYKESFKKCYLNNHGELEKIEIIFSNQEVVGIEYYKSDSRSSSDILNEYKDSVKMNKRGIIFVIKFISEQKKYNYTIRQEEIYSGCGNLDKPCRIDKFLIDDNKVLRAYSSRKNDDEYETIIKYKYYPNGDVMLESHVNKDKVLLMVYSKKKEVLNDEDLRQGKVFDKNRFMPFENLEYFNSKEFEPGKPFPKEELREEYTMDTSIRYLNELGLPTQKEYLHLNSQYSKLNYENSKLVDVEHYKNRELYKIDYLLEDEHKEPGIISKAVLVNIDIIIKKWINNRYYTLTIKTYVKGQLKNIEKKLFNNLHQEICNEYPDVTGQSAMYRTIKTFYYNNGHKAFSCEYNGKGELKLIILNQIPQYSSPFRYANKEELEIFRRVYFTNIDLSYYMNGTFNPLLK